MYNERVILIRADTSMISTEQVELIKAKYEVLNAEFDERSRRLWSAVEADSLGYGGIVAVSKATGLSESTIRLGQQELKSQLGSVETIQERHIRRQGGGRKSLLQEDSEILEALKKLVEPSRRGDPMSPLCWTCKSTRRLAKELSQEGHRVSHTKVYQLLRQLNYSLQSTRKNQEGSSHPDRDKQFEYINQQVQFFQRHNQPVVSVDAKKKEMVGNFANKGREYQPKGKPEEVCVYDFVDKNLGKAIPYGIYDVTQNCGWVSVGVDHDTAEFAIATLKQWWERMGKQMYPHAQQLLITADGGGSNSSRSRLWKIELQKFCQTTGLEVSVCHFPPGTSKWNKIEHRLFSHITENWRGRPLISYQVIVNLIANTRTEAGLHVEADIDRKQYPIGRKVSDDELAKVNLFHADFHGENWNYVIKPKV